VEMSPGGVSGGGPVEDVPWREPRKGPQEGVPLEGFPWEGTSGGGPMERSHGGVESRGSPRGVLSTEYLEGALAGFPGRGST
jgi:hypothetical protein